MKRNVLIKAIKKSLESLDPLKISVRFSGKDCVIVHVVSECFENFRLLPRITICLALIEYEIPKIGEKYTIIVSPLTKKVFEEYGIK